MKASHWLKIIIPLVYCVFRLEEAEPTTTAVEGEEEEGSGGGETESGEADAALSPIEEAKAQVGG